MNSIASIVFIMLGSTVAILLGCWGVEIIDENPFGWVLLAVGVGCPTGIIIHDRHRRK